jgi:hypothetical protein
MRGAAIPTDRKFGLTFGTMFFALAALAAWRQRTGIAIALVIVSMVFSGLALGAPALLAPLNRAWMGLARLLNRVTSPVVMGVVFFGIITPVAAVMRAAGRDALRLRRVSSATLWIRRDPPGPEPGSLHRQF